MPLRRIPGIERHQAMEAAHEEQRADHEDERHRQSARRPSRAAWRRGRVLRVAPRRWPERAAGLDAAGADDRREAEDEAGHAATAAVNASTRQSSSRSSVGAPLVGRRAPRPGARLSPCASRDAERGAADGEQRRTRRGTAGRAPAAMPPSARRIATSRVARRWRAPAQVGEVGAGHQQHEAGHAEQQPERRS